MAWIEKEGRTVDEARAAAIAASGRAESDLEIEVLREGAKGLFGLGGEAALVRARPRDEARDVRSAFESGLGASTPSDPGEQPRGDVEADASDEREPATSADAPDDDADEDAVPVAERQEAAEQVGVEMVKGILERMGLEGEVRSRTEGGTVYVEVFGDDMGILIGRGGATLEALQELVRAGVRRRVRARQAVVVDVEAYWERRRSGRRRE